MFTGLEKTTLGDVHVAMTPSPARVTDTAVGAHCVNTLPVPCAGQVHGQTLIDVNITVLPCVPRGTFTLIGSLQLNTAQ